MFSENFKILRTNNNYTQQDIARLLNVSQSTIGMWEAGRREPDISTINRIAQKFDVSPSFLISDIATENRKKGIKIPVLGKVRAGIPIDAIEEIIDYEEINEAQFKQGLFFGLRVQGDSMEPLLFDGDTVIVEKQEQVENGEIAIVLINGNDATIKKFYMSVEGITLIPVNNKYSPIFFTQAQVTTLPISILGRVVELRRKF